MSQQAPTYDPEQFEEPDDPVEESHMTLMEHLQELRVRLMWIGGALIIGTLISMLFAETIIGIIIAPVGERLQALRPTESLSTFFKVSFAAGAALSMPVIVYQLVAFIAPGLYPHERRNLFLILPGVMILFAAGVLFSYFMLLPVAVDFLLGFLNDVIEANWTITDYIDFAVRVTFWIGVSFEAPLVVAFLARAGIVSGPQLLRMWRQSIVVIAVLAAAITPTIDPVNMAIVMGPLIGLYFISVGLAYVLYKPREPRDFSVEPLVQDDEPDGD